MNKEFEYSINSDVAELMDDRGIKLEDIKKAVSNAEENGSKLYLKDANSFLTRFRNDNYTTQVEYELNGNECLVNNVYGHRVSIVSDDN